MSAEVEMMRTGIDIYWWISVIEIPILGLLFYLIRNNGEATIKGDEKLENKLDYQISELLKELSEFKLYSAKEYASISYIKDLEKRLTNHLIRIEEKVENTKL
ncbi:MAG: hypothetical protein N4A44_00575 [Alphaproteobacteria bacterium]|jgi:hypothetical protein|nr:hypothetical protein [Alphaproteobacteria bacterium]